MVTIIPEKRERIVDENYADLLIEYNADLSTFDVFSDASVHIIHKILATVHLPLLQIDNASIMEFGYSVMPSCFGLISKESLEASGVNRLQSIPSLALRGGGVIIGFLDTGIDYTNPVFINPDNTTRILSIWDQTIQSEDRYPEELYYGTEYTREEINQALNSTNPLSIVPSIDEIGHGTMLAGVAAGNDISQQNFSGVAPEAEIVVVKLKQAKTYLKNFFQIPEDVPCYQENDILFALKYIDSYALRENKPYVFCVALGTAQGAHDGRGTLSSLLSQYGKTIGQGVVVAAGNEGNERRHYYGEVDKNIGYTPVELQVGENEKGFSMELWGSSPNIFSIGIQSPSGEYIPRIPARLDQNKDVDFVFENTKIFIDYQMVESQSGDQLILVRFQNPVPGIWNIRVYGRGDLKLNFHIWLPMTPFISSNTYFITPDPYTTVLSLGNAPIPITVTAYNHEERNLYATASKGYTRLGEITPTIAAPGVNILSPSLNHDFVQVSGTSVASAHMAGVVALMLEWGIIKKNFPTMNTLTIKKFLIRGANRSKELAYPNPDWGYGILDVYNSFDILRNSGERSV